ncbi:MAG: ATPase [Clostridia bacterium]|nr:ATPase [Clostridia bacterium]
MPDHKDPIITLDALSDLPQGSYVLIDVRDAISFDYDTLPGAVSMPDIVEKARSGSLPEAFAGKLLVLFCMRGFESLEAAEALQALGLQAVSLEDGFSGWIRAHLPQESRAEEIEKDLRTKASRKKLFSRFTRAIREFDLVSEGDRIAVCISGGKDSMLMAKLFQELKRCRKAPFELVFLVMDPGYNELNRLVIERNTAMLGIPAVFFETPIFDAVDQMSDKPCFMCARMRRGYLYRKARELGCNKIALGHHFDDVIETILMAMLWGGQVQTMMPKVHSRNCEGMELIRPMYYIREEDIKAWRDEHGLHFIQCACHFTDTCSSCREDGVPVSKRMETKLLIRRLKETNPYVEANIFNSMQHVDLNSVLSYKLHGISHEFADNYAEYIPLPGEDPLDE